MAIISPCPLNMARARAGVAFRVSKPWVDRRETVRAAGRADAEAHAVIAGVEQMAACTIALAPAAGSEAATLVVLAEGPMVAVAEVELRARLLAGARVGALHGVVVQLLQLRADTTAEALVEQAVAKAFQGAVTKAGLVELEPWVTFEVLTPAASSTAVLADLGARASRRRHSRKQGQNNQLRHSPPQPRRRSIACGENRLGVPPPMKMLCTVRPQTSASAASRSAPSASR